MPLTGYTSDRSVLYLRPFITPAVWHTTVPTKFRTLIATYE